MSCPSIAVTAAVAHLLRAAELSRTATIRREYVKELTLERLDDEQVLDVRLYPGPVSGKPLGRQSKQYEVVVKLAFRKKLSGDSNRDIDPWMDYVQEVADYLSSLENRLLAIDPQATWHGEHWAAPYLPEHLRQFNQFTSVLEVTYVTTRG